MSSHSPSHRTILLVVLLLYALVSGLPTWLSVSRSRHARDFATYHYALQVALDGKDPYLPKELGRKARKEGTRKRVHPYFYPPPALLGMLWSAPFSLGAAYKISFWLNQASLFAAMWGLGRWLSLPMLVPALVALTFSPLPETIKMGQANILVLSLLVWGIWKKSGPWLATSAMVKMSPALLLGMWVVQKRYRACLLSITTAVTLSVITLPIIGLDNQLRFYLEILPQFASGNYNGLTVPIAMPGNHSLPDICNQIWPGETAHALHPKAKMASSALTLVMLLLLLWSSRKIQDRIDEFCVVGAFVVMMLLTPVYTYEHHLAFLVIPILALVRARLDGRLGNFWLWWSAAAYFFAALPLAWLRGIQKIFPPLHWYLQESKFASILMIGIACLVVVWSGRGGLTAMAGRLGGKRI